MKRSVGLAQIGESSYEPVGISAGLSGAILGCLLALRIRDLALYLKGDTVCARNTETCGIASDLLIGTWH